jgi:hypothetical protein
MNNKNNPEYNSLRFNNGSNMSLNNLNNFLPSFLVNDQNPQDLNITTFSSSNYDAMTPNGGQSYINRSGFGMPNSGRPQQHQRTFTPTGISGIRPPYSAQNLFFSQFGFGPMMGMNQFNQNVPYKHFNSMDFNNENVNKKANTSSFKKKDIRRVSGTSSFYSGSADSDTNSLHDATDLMTNMMIGQNSKFNKNKNKTKKYSNTNTSYSSNSSKGSSHSHGGGFTNTLKSKTEKKKSLFNKKDSNGGLDIEDFDNIEIFINNLGMELHDYICSQKGSRYIVTF